MLRPCAVLPTLASMPSFAFFLTVLLLAVAVGVLGGPWLLRILKRSSRSPERSLLVTVLVILAVAVLVLLVAGLFHSEKPPDRETDEFRSTVQGR